ncbi:MAG: FAD binding domain-containing protein [Actinomycetota bacterium]|nr:FAD binding domain-containing protein [Actinomycetota bacterium]
MSKPGITEYLRPDTLEEAWWHVEPGDPSLRILSGGADLTIHAPPEVTTLVDVGRVLDSTIQTMKDGSIHIGAMATLTDVMEHQDVAVHGSGVMPEMMVHVGNPLLRNFSTIGGHVARAKLSDVVPVFLALTAEIEYFNGADRSEPLQDYYDKGHHKEPHIVTGLQLPALPDRSAAAFLRFARTTFDFAILNVACRIDLDGDSVETVRIVVGSTPRLFQRAIEAEDLISEQGPTDTAIDRAGELARGEVRTGGGWVASAEYRSQLVEVLTRRCLGVVAGRLEAT